MVRGYNSAGESGACSYVLVMPNPPLNVTINHIGVKSDHDPFDLFQGPGDIKLILFITDGKQTISEVLPYGEGITYSLNDYETIQLNQQVFHTQSAGDFLKVVLIAYDDDPESMVSDIIQTSLPILGPIVGIPYASEISTVFSQYKEQTGKPLFENKDDYVGGFTDFWSSDQLWGIGQYQAEGTEDFLIWFSIWSDTEPPAIPKPILIPPSLSVISYGFSPNPLILGNSVNATISMTGGTAGNYTIRVLKDIGLWPDQPVTSYLINYTGSPTTESFSFKPTEIGSYHLDLQLNGTTLWSQPNDTSRLTVKSPTIQPLSVTSYMFSPNPIFLGNSSTVSISISGGSVGTYSLRIWRDIDLWPDQLITSFSISHNGTATTSSFSFTPNVAGSYHTDLIYNNTTLWSEPNDATRLKVQ
jgi:hypothetical protein